MAIANSSNGRPRLACEIGSDRVIAARLNPQQRALEIYASRKLPAGAVTPGLGSPNVHLSDAVRLAVGSALDAVAGSSKDVITILPDAAVRILLLDFDDLPQKYEEAAAVIRFRAKKSVPFDVDASALSFHVNRTLRPVRVVAAFSPRNVIEEYESLVLDAGYVPGIVLPSVIATLGMVESDSPTMVVKVDGTTTTVVIVRGAELVLLRTLEHAGRASLNPADITTNVLPSMVFFEDTYAARIERLLLTGASDLRPLAESLQAETNVRVEEISVSDAVRGDGLGDPLPPSMLAAVAGGLLG
ncbi:MAG TPA: hypothetical protein VM056_01810 [Terriglobales bacterium]|nr:hypothetical protein [Terriglobales bacterium]